MVATALMLPTVTLAGDSQPPLLLPLMAAIALGASAASGSQAAAANRPPAGQLSIIPPHMHIPDLYAVDDDRTPARFAEPLDNDRLFSIDLMPEAQRGWMAYLVYDSESPQVLGSSSTIVRLRLEYDF